MTAGYHSCRYTFPRLVPNLSEGSHWERNALMVCASSCSFAIAPYPGLDMQIFHAAMETFCCCEIHMSGEGGYKAMPIHIEVE